MLHPPARPHRRAALTALLFALTACAAVTATPEEAVDSQTAIETFDDVWNTVRERHFDPELNGVDWDAVRDEYRPRAAEASTQGELRGVINAMLGKLGQSHFGVMPRHTLPELGAETQAATGGEVSGDVGLDFRNVEGSVLVTRVAADGPAERAGVKPGWILSGIGADDVGRWVEGYERIDGGSARRMVRFALHERITDALIGPVESQVRLTFVDGDDRERALMLTRAERDVEAHNFGDNLPTFYLKFEHRILDLDEARVGLIHWSNWFLPVMQPIDLAVDEMRDCDGLVLDLRANGGGALGMVMGVAGHFFDEVTMLGTQTSREVESTYQAFPRKVNPRGKRVKPFAGPVAILIDGLTASASEVFAAGMQSTGRARIFGGTSAGAVLPAMTKSLPNGDAMIFAFGDFKTTSGDLVEGVGVIPDVEVVLTREALLSGADPALEAAVAWITANP